jgi:hypothetical protein
VYRLYGVTSQDTKKWRFMDYNNVLKLKIRLAWDRIKQLNKKDMKERDFENISDCLKAIKFNEALLEEIGVKYDGYVTG